MTESLSRWTKAFFFVGGQVKPAAPSDGLILLFYIQSLSVFHRINNDLKKDKSMPE